MCDLHLIDMYRDKWLLIGWNLLSTGTNEILKRQLGTGIPPSVRVSCTGTNATGRNPSTYPARTPVVRTGGKPRVSVSHGRRVDDNGTRGPECTAERTVASAGPDRFRTFPDGGERWKTSEHDSPEAAERTMAGRASGGGGGGSVRINDVLSSCASASTTEPPAHRSEQRRLSHGENTGRRRENQFARKAARAAIHVTLPVASAWLVKTCAHIAAAAAAAMNSPVSNVHGVAARLD